MYSKSNTMKNYIDNQFDVLFDVTEEIIQEKLISFNDYLNSNEFKEEIIEKIKEKNINLTFNDKTNIQLYSGEFFDSIKKNVREMSFIR